MPCLVSSIRSLWLAGTNSITTGSPFTPAAVSLPLMRTVFKDRYLPPPDACTCLASSSPVVCPDAAAASEPPSSTPMQHWRIMVILLSRARFAPRPLVRFAETRRRGGHAIPVDDRPSRAAGLRSWHRGAATQRHARERFSLFQGSFCAVSQSPCALSTRIPTTHPPAVSLELDKRASVQARSNAASARGHLSVERVPIHSP